MQLKKRDNMSVPPIEYIAATANETISVGECLKISSEKLTKAGQTDAVQYIAVGVPADGIVPVIRIQPGAIYEAPLAFASTTVNANFKVGATVVLHTDAIKVQDVATASSANGKFEVIDFDGKAADDLVRVRYIG